MCITILCLHYGKAPALQNFFYTVALQAPHTFISENFKNLFQNDDDDQELLHG